MELTTKYKVRNYKLNEVCYFRKTKELFGGLSNMASGFPIRVNGVQILTSEALYQACRFPHLPDVQHKVIDEKSPMTAKMVGKPFRNNSRQDWENVKVDIMYWCLRVKLAQNFLKFGHLLETTSDKAIVEFSSKDAFWGALKDKSEENSLVGINALGRLLMKLRQEYNSANRFDSLFVESLNIPNFLLYGDKINPVDERKSFIEKLENHWMINVYNPKQIEVINTHSQEQTPIEIPNEESYRIFTVNIEKPDKKKKAKPRKKYPANKSIQPHLPLH